jgi:TIR domain
MSDASTARVFISYSHADKRWLDRLLVHLRPLEREGILDVWGDTRIQAGAEWREELTNALAAAQVAILLISPYFMASDFIADVELPALLEAAQTKGTIIMPLIISASRFPQMPDLARYQSVNPPDLPLSAMRRADQDDVLNRLAQAVELRIRPSG